MGKIPSSLRQAPHMNIFGNTTIRSLKNLPSGRGEVSPPTWPLRDGLRCAMANFTPTLFLEGGARPLQQTDHSYQVTVGASDPNHTNVVPHKQKSPRAPQPWGRAVFSWNMPPSRLAKHPSGVLNQDPEESPRRPNTVCPQGGWRTPPF